MLSFLVLLLLEREGDFHFMSFFTYYDLAKVTALVLFTGTSLEAGASVFADCGNPLLVFIFQLG